MAIDLGDIPTGTPPTAGEKLQIRSAIGVGQTDAPTFLSVNVGSSTTSLSQLSIVGQAASNTLYLSAPNYIALNSDQISLMNASVRSGLWGRTTGITVLSGHYFGFSSSATDAGFPAATILARDADGILAQRNGTAAQTFRVYNTFPGTTANEWFEINWGPTGSNIVKIGTAHAGTGGARAMQIVAGNQMQIGGGGAVRWEMGVSMIPLSTDGVADIGQGGNRLRNIYMASWIRLGVTTVASLPAAATAGAGAKMFVNDALTPVFGSAVTGGGAVTVPVYSTGSAWNVG